MKRFLVMAAICGLSTAPLWAVNTFTPSVADLVNFQVLPTYTTDTDHGPLGVFFDPGYAGQSGLVGYSANGVGELGTELRWLGVGMEGLDLTGYDAFALILFNDDNQFWQHRLFAGNPANSDEANYSDWVNIAPFGGSAAIHLNLNGLDLDNLTIGFQVGPAVDPDGLFRPDTFYTSATPIPAPGGILLGAIGAGLVGWIRRRRGL